MGTSFLAIFKRRTISINIDVSITIFHKHCKFNKRTKSVANITIVTKDWQVREKFTDSLRIVQVNTKRLMIGLSRRIDFAPNELVSVFSDIVCCRGRTVRGAIVSRYPIIQRVVKRSTGLTTKSGLVTLILNSPLKPYACRAPSPTTALISKSFTLEQ